jgi:hypothetical protein
LYERTSLRSGQHSKRREASAYELAKAEIKKAENRAKRLGYESLADRIQKDPDFAQDRMHLLEGVEATLENNKANERVNWTQSNQRTKPTTESRKRLVQTWSNAGWSKKSEWQYRAAKAAGVTYGVRGAQGFSFDADHNSEICEWALFSFLVACILMFVMRVSYLAAKAAYQWYFENFANKASIGANSAGSCTSKLIRIYEVCADKNQEHNRKPKGRYVYSGNADTGNAPLPAFDGDLESDSDAEALPSDYVESGCDLISDFVSEDGKDAVISVAKSVLDGLQREASIEADANRGNPNVQDVDDDDSWYKDEHHDDEGRRIWWHGEDDDFIHEFFGMLIDHPTIRGACYQRPDRPKKEKRSRAAASARSTTTTVTAPCTCKPSPVTSSGRSTRRAG